MSYSTKRLWDNSSSTVLPPWHGGNQTLGNPAHETIAPSESCSKLLRDMTNIARKQLNEGPKACRLYILILAAFSALVFSPCASFANDAVSGTAEDTDTAFSEAVASFKAGKLEAAREGFLELESRYPNDPTLMLNLGLIAKTEKRPGAALGLWRKSLVDHPTNDELLNAIDWTRSKLLKAEIAHEKEFWEEFRRTVLTGVSPPLMTGSVALFLLLAGWRLIRWWAARRRALELETVMPAVPFGGFFLFFVFFIFLGLSISIYIDRAEIRGTILPTKVEVRSAPDISATELFDLFEGIEVIVRESRTVEGKIWRRITYPGGMTGWIRDRDILTSTDSSARAWEQ
jgi:hypothetical protein